jgi:hypothetical protein
MKRFAGLSLAAALGAALLSSVAFTGAAQAASLGAVAEVAGQAAPAAVEAQFRGARGGRVGGGRVGGGRAIAGGRVGGGRVAGARFGGGRGYYRGGRGAGIAAGVVGAAILGGIIAESQRQAYDEQYYYGGPVYAPAPVYEEPVYVRPRRYYRRNDGLPPNPIRDPAGGGLTTGGY